jgi:hypothetical protein
MGFSRFASTEATIEDLVEEAQQVGQVEPEPAVQAAGIETAVDQGIVPLDHHEPLAFQAMHD